MPFQGSLLNRGVKCEKGTAAMERGGLCGAQDSQGSRPSQSRAGQTRPGEAMTVANLKR